MLWEAYPAAHGGLLTTEPRLLLLCLQRKQISRGRHCHTPTQDSNCIRMLLIDYSSAFKTIIPEILVDKLINISLPPLHLCLDQGFSVQIALSWGTAGFSTMTLSTGSHQGSVLSPLLYTHPHTNDCTPTYPSNTIIKFAMTLQSLVSSVKGIKLRTGRGLKTGGMVRWTFSSTPSKLR